MKIKEGCGVDFSRTSSSATSTSTRSPNPVFEGDTVHSRSEVLEIHESRSRPNVGIVTVPTTGFNQDGTEVISFRRTALMYRRGQGPSAKAPKP
jgi:itaconyl-CoA hydratase